MRSLRVTASLALLLASSCSTREPGTSRRQPGADQDSALPATSVAAATPQQDSIAVPQATTGPVERSRQGRPVTLRGVRAARGGEAGPDYDRVVFEFAGDSAAGYRVAYADGPVRRCGSGDPVTVQGTVQLLVRLQPAQAHDASGAPALAATARALAPNLPAVKEIKLICDFEGQVQWVLGISGRTGYRVSELTGPPRVVIDVAHPR